MDQDNIADKHHRPPSKTCFYLSNCFCGVSTEEEEDDVKPQRKPKSISRSGSSSGWFSCSRLRSKKFPKRTVPVDSSTDDQKMMINIHEITAPPINIPIKPGSRSGSDELPVKVDEENQIQPPSEAAGQVLIGKAKKTSKGNILLRNSKSMNHIQSLKYSTTTSKLVASPSSLRKCTSAKSTTTLINQPAAGTHLVGLSVAATAVEDSQPPPVQQAALTGCRNPEGVKSNKTDEKNKGSVDRVVGISFIVMVLLIMVGLGKLYGILCFCIWLYFYPFLNIAKNSGQQDNVGQTKDSKSFELHTTSLGCDSKKKVVFQGFLQRDHHII